MVLRVYYSPTKSNELVAQALTTSRFKFIRLNPIAENRKEQLRTIPGQAVLIWGDGERHEESYHFTKGRVDMKFNADQHTDTYPHSPTADRVVGFWNHMDHTRSDGIGILTQIDSNLMVELAATRLIRLRGICPSGYHETSFRGVSITIDGDGITSFPARPSWVNMDGFSLSSLPHLIESAGPGLVRLDMGGLVEDIPPFTLRCNASVPSYSDAYEFSDLAIQFGMDNKPINGKQHLVDAVASYAVLAYKTVLTSFADLIGA